MHARATIGFGFSSDWLKKWHKNFEPITELSRDVTAAMLVYPTNPLGIESSIVMQTFSFVSVEKQGY